MRVLRGLLRTFRCSALAVAEQVELARVAGRGQLVENRLDAKLGFFDLDIEQFAVGCHGFAIRAQLARLGLQTLDLRTQPLVFRRQGVCLMQHAPDLGGQLFEFVEHSACRVR
jgi:hypothetical protein